MSDLFLSNLLNENVADQEIYLPELRPQIKSYLTLLSIYYYTGC
ncbi:hypothetical protein GN958_ATG10372 [Phytophthora infestans]|uniref:Uncharacterized protein n=1 Tax=Phytophthora infestans TaxID=4787 RepID=A0A8S9UHV1_PHYIN|nr:hypothetical protein GN958_ATG13011 [Phytophthora infestans]KAF4140438.1 hypothetical protein GN958_ATG10372 [Phytophthora infestans]